MTVYNVIICVAVVISLMNSYKKDKIINNYQKELKLKNNLIGSLESSLNNCEQRMETFANCNK